MKNNFLILAVFIFSISLGSSKTFNTENWLKYIKDDTHLNQIIIPSTHDSGTSNPSYCSNEKMELPTEVVSNFTITQHHNIDQQLQDGIRMFDIRPRIKKTSIFSNNREIFNSHRSPENGYLGCDSEKIEDDFKIFNHFLSNNPSEFIIAKINLSNNMYSNNPNNRNYNPNFYNDVLNYFASYNTDNRFYFSNETNFSNIKLKDLRGKILILFDPDYNKYIESYNNLYLFNFWDREFLLNQKIVLHALSTETTNINDMTEDQLKQLRQDGGLGKNILHEVTYTLTPNSDYITKNPLSSTMQLVNQANENIPDILSKIRSLGIFPNIFTIDGANKEISSDIIDMNFDKTKQPNNYFNTLYAGQKIDSGEYLLSANGEYKLILQKEDGNLVLYKNTNPIWASHKYFYNTNLSLKLSNTCNLQVVDSNNIVEYTMFSPQKIINKCSFKIKNDGNLVIYDSNKTQLFSVSPQSLSN